MIECFKKNSLYGVFAISLVAALVSLYFSSILGWVPCVLCWYQRILLYPIVIVSMIAILYKDAKAYRYILPLSVTGFFVALFHNLLYWKIIPESIVPCQAGVSCIDKQLELFGFVTIPLLSLLVFIIINILILMYKRNENK